MNLYVCRYDEQDWISYVFAETRGKAKYLFNKFWGGGDEEFYWVRSSLVGKSDSVKIPTVVDCEEDEHYPAVLELCDGYVDEYMAEVTLTPEQSEIWRSSLAATVGAAWEVKA